MELGFWIPIASGIPDFFMSCISDSTSKFFSDFGRFHKPNFSGFQNPDSLTWGELNVSFFLPSTQKGLLLHTVDNERVRSREVTFCENQLIGQETSVRCPHY